MALEFGFGNLPANLHALLDLRADEDSDATFVLMGNDAWTYGNLQNLSRRLAGRLAGEGVGAADRVMVLMPASDIQLGLWFALSRLNAVEVPVNPAYKGQLLRQLVETAAPSLCIVDDAFLDEFRSASAGLVAPDRIIRAVELRAAPERPELDLSAQEAGSRDIASIIFTSGTTGRSKGVMLCHSQELAFGVAFAEIVGLSETDTAYNFLPFFHIAAKFVALGAMLARGRMLLRPGFSVSAFWSDVRQHGVTVCAAVGGLCHMLNSVPRQDNDADNPLRIIYAVPVPWEFKTDFEMRFGITFIEGYGATENNLVAYSRPGEETPRNSLGRPSPHFDIQIQNEAGRAVAPGVPGEICIRPQHPGTIMSGYFGMPEKSLEVMTDLWFHTGDRGYADEAGYIFFQDRLKDAIRRRGENISTFEVERILNAFEPIAECAVIAVPSEFGEDEVKAVVVLKEPADVSEEEVFRFAANQMPYFMVPRFIEFRAELPRTPTMKIKKTELRAEGNGPATWDCERAGLRVTRHGLEPRATELTSG